MKRELNIDHLSRVEGHGAVKIVFENENLKEIKLRFTEGPRFFEVITKERLYVELPKIVSRICGICYASHRLACCFAIEDAFNVKVNKGIELLRKLLAIGEIIESHSLHIFFLSLPDYIGYPSALEMAKDYPNIVKRGFRIKEVGNRILKTIGGKTVHGENIVVGGFEFIPQVETLKEIRKELISIIPEIESTIFFLDSLNYPNFNSPYEIELTLKGTLPCNFSEEVKASDKTIFTKKEYEYFIREEVVPFSTAKVSTFNGKPFLIGPLARVNSLVREGKLSEKVKTIVSNLKNSFPTKNTFLANLGRAIEILELSLKGLEIIDTLLELYPFPSKEEVKPQEGIGFGVKEAPRGILFHKYQFNKEGRCVGANIITPTSQLQAVINQDLHYLLSKVKDLEEVEIKKRAELMIRAYDP
ncbi:Ni/Fe hydrogenase subunit alpha [Thermovibrio sp.]